MNLTQHCQQNDRFHVAAQAAQCAHWLKSQGFEVLAITHGPRILVRSNALCDRLEGAVQGYSRGPTGFQEHYKTVIRFGCQVRWAVKGGAA